MTNFDSYYQQPHKGQSKTKVWLMVLSIIIVVGIAAFLFIPRYLAIREAENAISNLGAITIDSLEEIESAERVYTALPEKDRAKVSNYSKLLEAKSEYEKLSILLLQTSKAIDAIPYPVDIEFIQLVENARKLYDQAVCMGLDKKLTEYQESLEILESLYFYDYAESLLSQATDFYANKNYQDAISLCDQIILNYETHNYPAKVCASDCYAEMAAAEIKQNKLEEAWNLLKIADDNYTCSDIWNTTNDNLEKSLRNIRPANGKKLSNTLKWGYGEFTVKAGDEDVCVKLESVNNPQQYLLLYVHAFNSATVQICDGEYIAKYTTGPNWFGNEKMFGNSASFAKADDTFSFETTRSGNTVSYTSISITIYKVINGNLETIPLEPEQF